MLICGGVIFAVKFLSKQDRCDEYVNYQNNISLYRFEIMLFEIVKDMLIMVINYLHLQNSMFNVLTLHYIILVN